MRRLLLGLAAGLALVSAAAGAPAKETATLYGLLERSGPDPLARLDPSTLRPVGHPLVVGSFNSVWAYSPDRAQLAFAWSYNATLGHSAAIRLVDLRRWRAGRVIQLPGRVGQARALTWSRGRLLLLLDGGRYHELVALETASGRIVGARRVDGSVGRVAVGPGRLAALVSPRDAIGPARLLLVDTTLAVATIRLDRITVGQHWERGPADEPTGHMRMPGLVVDPAWTNAFVLSADEAPAAVDLRAHTVAYGSGRALARVAKQVDGPWRFGLWAGSGRVVFGGIDQSGRTASRIGVSLVDTAGWSSKPLDGTATTAAVGGGLILTWDAWPGPGRTPGLRAFTTGGAPAWSTLAGSGVSHVQATSTRALVRVSGTAAKVVDLRSGEVVASLNGDIPRLLLESGSPW